MYFQMIHRLLFFCFSVFTLLGKAQLSGNKSFEFLKIPSSSRAAALGGNIITSGDNDFNLSFSNPALLSDAMNNHLAFNYINHFTDINGGYVAFAKKIKSKHVLGFGLQYLDYGTFKNADEYGNINGTFGANDMSFNVSYAFPTKDSNTTLGVSLKNIYSNLYGYTSFATAIDIGGQYKFKKYNVTVAGLIQNIGYQWKGYTPQTKEKLPFQTQLGISKKLKHAPFILYMTYEDIEKWNLAGTTLLPAPAKDTTKKMSAFTQKFKRFGNNLMLHLNLGTELVISKSVYVRMGYNYERRRELKVDSRKGLAGFSFGIGLRLNKFNVSYSRAIYSIAGVSNNLSLSLNLGSLYQKKSVN
jgi:hypothetical protein